MVVRRSRVQLDPFSRGRIVGIGGAVVRGCSLLAPQPPWHAEGGHGCVGGWLGPLSHHPTKNVSDVSDVVLSLAGACHPCQIAI